MKATPGPWTAKGEGAMGYGGSTVLHAHFDGDIDAANGVAIVHRSCLLGVTGATPDEAAANARLIAAAPELLATCRLALRHFEPISDPRKDTPCLDALARAIAKAEGVK